MTEPDRLGGTVPSVIVGTGVPEILKGRMISAEDRRAVEHASLPSVRYPWVPWWKN